jgi:hypothetical protein
LTAPGEENSLLVKELGELQELFFAAGTTRCYCSGMDTSAEMGRPQSGDRPARRPVGRSGADRKSGARLPLAASSAHPALSMVAVQPVVLRGGPGELGKDRLSEVWSRYPHINDFTTAHPADRS